MRELTGLLYGNICCHGNLVAAETGPDVAETTAERPAVEKEE